MVMPTAGIPTLNQIVAHYENRDLPGLLPPTVEPTRAEREWSAAIAALGQLLQYLFSTPSTASPAGQCLGIVLAGPSPVLEQPQLLEQLHVGLFRPQPLEAIAIQQFQLPAAHAQSSSDFTPTSQDYPLVPHDLLVQEQFCLVLTPKLSLVLVLATDEQGQAAFRFSFSPEVIEHCWQGLRIRLHLTSPQLVPRLEQLVAQFPPAIPDERLTTAFTRQLLEHFPSIATPIPTIAAPIRKPSKSAVSCPAEADHAEMELLQALTHEIRTPLTTIRMWTRLLLKKRKTLSEDVAKRLESIDQECTDQINRMELIFRAAELETQAAEKCDRIQLIPLALQQVIQQHIPQWQKQAQRRRITLDIGLPSQLPAIVSHPALLAQVLSGLMERLTRSLPSGSAVQVNVTTAGNQLKLQFLSQDVVLSKSLKSLGQLLMFQPETGSLSLNLEVTKNLFQTLGGKLTVRQRSLQGEELTIFLPLDSYQMSA
ncbi:MAG: HAMP domain-containing histidine kinase [Spirulina sp. SIO3F2]|nr:HAMP domain-containing histidine kinase [Spirulina sp. SIO3F2]